MRRKYSGFPLKGAMQLLGIEQLTRWELDVLPRPPSEHLKEDLRRFEAFDLVSTEGAKLLIVDALLAEIVPDYPSLKVWKAARLESDMLIGVADYIIAPRRAYWRGFRDRSLHHTGSARSVRRARLPLRRLRRGCGRCTGADHPRADHK